MTVSAAGMAVVGWVVTTAWDAVRHAHPAYPVLLVATAAGCAVALWFACARRGRRGRWRAMLRIALVALGVLEIAAVAWLRPRAAVEPALSAMRSDGSVQVTETWRDIVLAPARGGDSTALFMQPGALVDARAYAALLRPIAADGHVVVIAKQPLGIAFLAVEAFDNARRDHPEASRWVVAGHSLGGTVAAIEAQAAQHDTVAAPAAGLLLYASYPAADMSRTLVIPVRSVSGTRDGLATTAKIAASRAELPPASEFTVIEGASHAQFGSYGPQRGDLTPTIGDAAARRQITEATRQFIARLARG